ncbi:MAG: transporter substrate-binding domain-containing protein [Chloroflexi bacterium]|nr:transporter substrate-binding domain-containing protein [Chloroflexota bacterium]
MSTRRPIVVALAALLAFAACTSAGPTIAPQSAAPSVAPSVAATPSEAPSEEPTQEPSEAPSLEPTAVPTAVPTVVPSPEPAVVSEACMAANLTGLKNPGRLTLSTDNPAFPPWWGGDPETQYPNEPEGGSGWDFSDPYSMEGYESAIAYAVAAELGFGPELVDWIPNTVFSQAFQPGPKRFDFHMAQISIRPRRAEAVDFSDPYFQANQSILAVTATPITSVTTIAGLKDFKLGAAVGTTSFELIEMVVQPNVEPSVFDDNDIARRALRNGQIDGLVVDLQTAFFMRDVQMGGEGVVIGQFDVAAQADPVGMVLQKGSSLTACVNEALGVMALNGTTQAIYDAWISTGQEVPFFE